MSEILNRLTGRVMRQDLSTSHMRAAEATATADRSSSLAEDESGHVRARNDHEQASRAWRMLNTSKVTQEKIDYHDRKAIEHHGSAFQCHKDG